MTIVIWLTSAALFTLGVAMIALRRQLLAMLFGLELAIAGVNVSLVHSAATRGDSDALAAVVLIIAIAAAEAVVGLAFILSLRREGQGADAAVLTGLGR